MKDIPRGRRFSQVYISRGEPVTDSSRMRLRMAVLATRREADGLWSLLRQELGVPVRPGSGGVHPEFYEEAELRDLLDSITLIYGYWKRGGYFHVADEFLAGTRRIFAEENVGYRVDDDGGVHYLVDAAFEGSRAAVVSALTASRYANARLMLENGMAALDEVPVNGKQALRSIFSSAEGLFRLMFPSAPRLGAAEIDRWLRPAVEGLNGSNRTAKLAALKLLGSFKDWVDAVHFYRHEPGTEEPAQPPIALAVALISQGIGFIRWLAEVDAIPVISPSTSPPEN